MSALAEADQIIVRRALAVVARREGLAIDDVLRPRGRFRQRLRRVAVYLAVTSGRVPKKTAAQILGTTRWHVQVMCGDVEALRDAPRFDRDLGKMEREIFQ